MNAVRVSLFVAILAVAGAPAGARAQAHHPSRVTFTFDHLYTYEEMSAAFHEIVAAYPELLSIQSIGKSYEGRDLWLITVNNRKTGGDRDKPAMYIDGNIHGNEVQAAEVAFYTIWYLTKSYGAVETLTELLDDCAFYILPMVNPDARAAWFEKPNTAHSRSNATLYDSRTLGRRGGVTRSDWGGPLVEPA